MKYFRRPQTAFVNDDANLSQKPQSQWTLANTTTSSSSSSSSSATETIKEAPSTQANGNDRTSADTPSRNGEPNTKKEKDGTNGHSTTTPTTLTEDVEEITQSLETRFKLNVQHHPESVLLCGYFEEQIHTTDNQTILTLSTYLPGVSVQELRVYYGQGVLKIAGARALYQVVQRFERSFAVEERLVDTTQFRAALADGMLLIRVPLLQPPRPPLSIRVIEASPMTLFRHYNNNNMLVLDDIDVPGVALQDLTVEYDNGMIRLVWNRMEPVLEDDSHRTVEQDSTKGDPLASNNNNNNIRLQQVRYQRDIPISTFGIDTSQLKAYLDCHSKPTNVLVITAPLVKKKMMPIQVQTR